MENRQSKEEGELSDEDENGKNKQNFSVSKLTGNSNSHLNGATNFKPNSEFGKLSRPDQYHKFKSHVQQTQSSTHGTLPNPRQILPQPSPLPHSHKKKEQERACIVIKNNSAVNSNRNRRESTTDASEISLKSPTSKIWDNRKLRTSMDKYKKGTTNDGDNYQTLLQQYKDIQRQPACIKHPLDLLHEPAATASVEKKRLSSEQVIGDTAETVLEKQVENIKEETKEDIGDVEVQDEEFDDELDLLELRRNALASLLAEAREDGETEESENSSHGGIVKASDESSKTTRRTSREKSSPKTFQRPSNRDGLSKSQNRNKSKNDARAQRHSRFLRARTPALRSYKTSSFTSRRPYKIDDRTPRKPIPYTRTRQNSYPSRSSISTGRLRLSSKEERPVTRRNSSDKRSYLADSNDIQKILSLDDPEEKIARLLSMLDKNLSKESEKRALDVKVSSKTIEGVDSEPTHDNYEEVEMDIDSDPESAPAAPVNPVEELQFEPDFYNAMQPMYMTMQPTYEGYDPAMGWSIQGPSFSDTAIHASASQPQQYPPAPLISFSDSHVSMMPYNTAMFQDISRPYQFVDQHSLQMVPDQMSGLRDILPPPPPPPLPCEPPPNPPLPPSDSPPLPTCSPPPLPTESLPPPPPEGDSESHDQIQFMNNLPMTNTFQPNQQYMANLNFNNSNNDLNGHEDQDYRLRGNIEINHDVSHHGMSESRLFKLAGYSPTTIPDSWNSRNKEVVNLDRSGEFGNLADDTTGIGNERRPLAVPEVVTEEDDDGEEEEAMLRAHLLQSMMKKMKEKQKLLEDASRSDSSLSRSQSPSSVPVVRPAKPIPQKQAYSRIHMANLPIHKPVIINFT